MKKKLLLTSLALGLAVGIVNTGYALNKTLKHQSSSQLKSIEADKVVSVYVLIDTDKDMENFKSFVNSHEKLPFNRVLLSFLRPTFPHYEKNSLANSGMVGNFNTPAAQEAQAKLQFRELKSVITELQQKHVSAFLSVGGWNYSCNYQVYGELCGGSDKDNYFDWFPDPTDPAQSEIANKSYHNLVDLAHDLGANGLDWDYEEFWHADAHSSSWDAIERAGEWTVVPDSVRNNPSYANIVSLAGAHEALDGTKAAIMDKTIAKIDGILHSAIDYDDAKYKEHPLEWSTATAASGGRPIKGFVYGDSKKPTSNNLGIDHSGGVWWGGNLKGSVYELVDKDPAIVNRFTDIGLMTYDVCNGQDSKWNGTKCSVDGTGVDEKSGHVTDPSKFTLEYQVSAYMHDYENWLYSSSPKAAYFDDPAKVGWKTIFHPAKYKIKPRLQFGYEVNKPAFPKVDAAQVQLLKSDVVTINKNMANAGGVIIWQFFSKQNTTVAGSATIADTVSQSCETFLKNDSRYDCAVQVPSFNN